MDEKGLTLEQQMPDVYRQLLDVRDRLETHFRDMCDIEFTIERGRLFILDVRPGKRTLRANLAILLQFLAEGKIGVRDVLSRVKLADVEETCKPQIHNLTSLLFLGQGMAACTGAATGEIVFDASVALQLARRGRRYVLIKDEVSAEDIEALWLAQGVVTTRGGMASHAALLCRSLGKPCVVGLGEMEIHPRDGYMIVPKHRPFESGQWVTLDGSTGCLYAGEGEISASGWREHPELIALSQVIDLAIRAEDVPLTTVGGTWKIRDFFAHNLPLRRTHTTKRAARKQPFVAFGQPTQRTLNEVHARLTAIKAEERENYSAILMTMADSLSRLLSSALGIGNHHRYCRPLWDPASTIHQQGADFAVQMIGFEFFGINQHLAHLVDVATVTFVAQVELKRTQDQWVLDRTNRRGEALVVGSDAVTAYSLWLNDGRVSHQDLPLLYHTLRRREYEWKYYQVNDTSHAAFIEFLESWSKDKRGDRRFIPLCFELGLLRRHGLTLAGESLLGRCRRSHTYEFI